MWTRLVDTQTHTDLSNWQSTHHTAVNSSLSLHHHHWMHDLSKLESDPCEVAYVLLRVGRCSACRLPLFFSPVSDPNFFFFENKWSQLDIDTLFLPPAGHLLIVWWCCVRWREFRYMLLFSVALWIERTSDASTWRRRSRRHVDRRILSSLGQYCPS